MGLKVCTGALLPETKVEFYETLKYLLKFCGLYGSLSKVAECLRISHRRHKHQAGSDSLLTARTFIELSVTIFNGIHKISKHQGILYGLAWNGDVENENC